MDSWKARLRKVAELARRRIGPSTQDTRDDARNASVLPEVAPHEIEMCVSQQFGRAVHLTRFSGRPMSGGTGARQSIFRFWGCAVADGEELDWSCILKIGRAEGSDSDQGRRDYHAYRSGLLSDLGGELSAPRLYGSSDSDTGEYRIWIEEILPDAPASREEGYKIRAQALGGFNGLYVANRWVPENEWLMKDRIQLWLKGAAPLIAQLESWSRNPLLAPYFTRQHVDDLLALWERRNEILARLEKLPQTLCHGDASEANLIVRRRGKTFETVAIDWELMGPGVMGEDLASLMGAAPVLAGLDFDSVLALDSVVFPAYVEGLRRAGWRGEEEDVHRGYTGALALRYAFGVLGLMMVVGLNPSEREVAERVMKRPAEKILTDFVCGQRFALRMGQEFMASR